MISPVVAWMMRIWRPLTSIRMGVRAWVRPTPMWCSRPLCRGLSFAAGVDDVVADAWLGFSFGGASGGGFGPGLAEADAREGERKGIPPELQANMEEMNKISIGEPEFFDLRQPVMLSPK
jgi:hypothetical protein